MAGKRIETTGNSDASSLPSETSEKKKKKKGLIRSIFKGKKRRRRKRKSGSDSDSLVSYDSYGAQSETSSPLKGSSPSPVAATTTSPAQQEWINGGGNGLADMAAIDSNGSKRFNSYGKSLPKITEGFNEDASGDFNKESSGHRRGKRRGTRPKPSTDGSVTSKDKTTTRKNKKGLFRSKEKAVADPLSLVVLLVEPTSLRFELLSLDFDLTTKKPNWKERRRAKKKSEESAVAALPPPELDLTVQDVLDQITPTALTDEKLRKKVETPGSCLGLIDRTGTVHFGETSLETACAERPLREFDRQLLKNDDQRGSYLSVPTYGGEPHRDVLLGFFGKAPEAEASSASSANPWTEAVSKTLELARPIFADPNVIGLMESSGYNLVGWKPGSVAPEPAAVLGKPPPPPVRSKQPSFVSSMKQPAMALIVLLLATFLAWSVVSTGLGLLPSIEDVVSPESGGETASPKTLEGYVARGFGMLFDKNKDILAAK